jgi:hypothetical protein
VRENIHFCDERKQIGTPPFAKAAKRMEAQVIYLSLIASRCFYPCGLSTLPIHF